MTTREAVAVFGRADAGPEGAEYARARALGRALAARGYDLVTGGYGGVMEAASLGAREGGASTSGVLCRAFVGRRPNPHLDRERWTEDLFERTRVLLEEASAFVAMQPRSGTLAEVFTLLALWKGGQLSPRPLVLVGLEWRRLWDRVEEGGMVEGNLLQCIACAPGPEEAADTVERALRERGR